MLEALQKGTLNTIVEPLQQLITTSVQTWLKEHPVLAWLFDHPLGTLLLFILLWLLLGGLLKAISSLTERVWVTLLQSPLKLTQWLVGKVSKNLSIPLNFAIVASPPETKEKRLSYIVNRLEELKKEQDELWQEMTKILDLKS